MQADFACEIAQVDERVVRGRVGTAARHGKGALEKRQEPVGERVVPADLRDVHHFADNGLQALRILVRAQRAPQHQHDGREHDLRDIGGNTQARRAG